MLQVINNVDVGGAEKRLLDIARHVNRDLVELHFCTFSSTTGALEDEFISAGVTFHSLRPGVRFPFQFKRLLQEIE